MMNGPVIDADGHVLEKERYIRKYLETPWDKRSTSLRTRDQPWDANLFDSFEMAVRWEDLSPKEQIDEWHAQGEVVAFDRNSYRGFAFADLFDQSNQRRRRGRIILRCAGGFHRGDGLLAGKIVEQLIIIAH